jgi:hypothetical protein
LNFYQNQPKIKIQKQRLPIISSPCQIICPKSSKPSSKIPKKPKKNKITPIKLLAKYYYLFIMIAPSVKFKPSVPIHLCAFPPMSRVSLLKCNDSNSKGLATSVPIYTKSIKDKFRSIVNTTPWKSKHRRNIKNNKFNTKNISSGGKIRCTSHYTDTGMTIQVLDN